MRRILSSLLPSWAVPDVLPEFVGKREVKLAVPAFAQTDAYSCGAVAAFSVVRTFRMDVSFQEVWAVARPSERWGMSAQRVAQTLRRFQIGVAERTCLTARELRQSINDGYPIVVSIRNHGSSHGHWVVVYGYGNRPSHICICGQARPGFSRQRLVWREFRQIWDPPGNGLICWGK